MSTITQISYVASCLICEGHQHFDSYEGRSDWVGRHRVKTGHQVAVWLEPK